jgi:hypothetical protein
MPMFDESTCAIFNLLIINYRLSGDSCLFDATESKLRSIQTPADKDPREGLN